MKKALLLTIVLTLISTMLLGCAANETFPDKDMPEGLPLRYNHNSFNEDGSVNIEVYVNDEKVDVKVLADEDGPNIQVLNNLGDYVQAKPVIEYLGASYKADEQNNVLILSSDKYGEIKYTLDDNAKTIDDELYINFKLFKMLTNGSVKQEDYKAMYLYTEDYERTDLPATLEEAYTMLDEVLTKEEIEYLKIISEDELKNERYGLGHWIRNKWLFPNHSKLTVLFEQNGVDNQNTMGEIILNGYVRYLRGEPCSLQDMLSTDV